MPLASVFPTRRRELEFGRPSHKEGLWILKHSKKKIAYLEFVNDQLESEIAYIDTLLRDAGFDEGLATIKDVVLEVIEEENPEE